jgi:hypothetical protein
LLLWRECVAVEADESPAYVCPASLLLDIAQAASRFYGPNSPMVAADLARLFSPLPPLVLRPHTSTANSSASDVGDCAEILEAIAKAVTEFQEDEASAAAAAAAAAAAKEGALEEEEASRERAAVQEEGEEEGSEEGGPRDMWAVAGWVHSLGGLSTGRVLGRGMHIPTVTLLAVGSIILLRGLANYWTSSRK